LLQLDEHNAHLPCKGQLDLEEGSLDLPGADPVKLVSGHGVPELGERHGFTFVVVVSLVGFESADDPVANGKDLGDHLVAGKP